MTDLITREFTADELAAIREMLHQRYREEIEIHLADSEIVLHNPTQPDPDTDTDPETNTAPDPKPVTCPTVYWHARDANFVIVKIAPLRYRTQFFYTPHEQFGTGIDEYHDLNECVAAVLQTQSDHERQRAKAEPIQPTNPTNPTKPT